MAYTSNSNVTIDVFLDQHDVTKMHQAMKKALPHAFFIRITASMKSVYEEEPECDVELQVLDDDKGEYTKL